MEKLKITRDQKIKWDKLLEVNSGVLKKISAERMIKNFMKMKEFKKTCDPNQEFLLEFETEDLMKLLCGWYEVEQPFKVGDWVYIQIWDIFRQVEEIKNNRLYYMHDGMLDCDLINEFEKVTEPWKIMLLELGRDKPRFNKNDIIVTDSEVYKADWLTDKEIINLYEKGLVKAFHAYENRIEVKDYDRNRE